MSQPRRTYYFFAHVALRSLFLSKPGDVIAAFEHTGARMLVDLWEYSAQQAGEEYPSDGLACEVRHTPDGGVIGLVTLPEPQEMTECYYVALCFALGESPRYITCELTVRFGEENAGKQFAVMCEWSNGTHMNTGQIFDPDREDFYNRMVERLATALE
jgi:hypothetical protein